MQSKILLRFSSKKSKFFWTEINSNVIQAEYAVRGIVPTLANLIKDQLVTKPNSYPFNEITFCNIGNPQQFHQKPVTFNREVLSCLLNPALINNPTMNPDAGRRAQSYLDQIISAGSYTHSLGIPLVRQSVANYIQQTDGVERPQIADIFLTEGASQGVHLLLSTMITGRSDAIMIPVPQYPLYSASIALYGGTATSYYLNEEKGWRLDIEELKRSITEARKQGNKVKAIVVINPGNPTGSVLEANTIKEIITFAVENNLVILADEVYRENVYKENTKFSSFRRVLNGMSPEIKEQCELASLHSVSKGLLGECGLRGGYLYLHNFNPTVFEQLVKLKSINLCSNSIGQAMVELMVNPPINGVSSETKSKFEKEYAALYSSLKHRAKLVTSALRAMNNVTCNEVEGAMYAFPSVKFSQKAIEAAEGKPVDLFYCLEVLKNTGIALVPGSGFKQKPNTYHFRITTLILPEDKLQQKLSQLKTFNDSFHLKYS